MTRNKKIVILGMVVIILLMGFFLIWNPFFGFYGVEVPININESEKENIKIYLEENIWKPNRGGKTFCAYEILGEESGLDIHQYYLWALCKEYYLENSKLREAGGTSLPVAITLQRESNTYKVIGHEVPRNGSFYKEEIERIFPENIRRNKMFSNDVNYHNQHIRVLEDEIKNNL